MGLQIIGAGLGRTGTLSVCTALNQLGLPCYHMFEVIDNERNKSHLDFWRKVARAQPGAQHDWAQVFSNYAATVDNPGCCVWPELLATYPEAKVILTVHPRGPDAWYESTLNTIYFTETMWQFKVLELVTPFGRKMGDMTRRLIWQRSLQGTMSDRATAIERYHQHIAEVIAAVPEEKLLIFSVDQGWKPLCEFLGKPEPASEFPNVNDRANTKQTITNITRGAYLVLGIAALVVVSILGLTIGLANGYF